MGFNPRKVRRRRHIRHTYDACCWLIYIAAWVRVLPHTDPIERDFMTPPLDADAEASFTPEGSNARATPAARARAAAQAGAPASEGSGRASRGSGWARAWDAARVRRPLPTKAWGGTSLADETPMKIKPG